MLREMMCARIAIWMESQEGIGDGNENEEYMAGG